MLTPPDQKTAAGVHLYAIKPTSSTAILLFARSARAEARAKPLSGLADLDERLHRQLLATTLSTLEASGLPLLRSDERTQCGVRYGERIAHALTSAFAQGYERIIVVGADCPELSAAQLAGAVEALERGEQVVGADRRGGVYLMGLQAAHFRAEEFRRAPWRGKHIAAHLAAQLSLNTPLTWLDATLRDVNDRGDLHALASDLSASSSRWACLLRAFFRVRRRALPVYVGSRRAASVAALVDAQRGPPATAA